MRNGVVLEKRRKKESAREGMSDREVERKEKGVGRDGEWEEGDGKVCATRMKRTGK